LRLEFPHIIVEEASRHLEQHSMSWLFGSSSSSSKSSPAPSKAEASQEEEEAKCPVDHSTRARWIQQNESSSSPHPFAGSASASAGTAPAKAAPARAPILSNERETSTIPRHLEGSSGSDSKNWVYPSPSQFFTALQRKNRNPNAEDMDTVVPIHNAVNERTWHEVLKWEAEANAGKTDTVELVSFKGRPQDRTPRAWWKVLLG
jgi:cytochrome c heme-lyase